MTTTQTANAQHKAEAASGKWTPVGNGLLRHYVNAAGWAIHRGAANNGLWWIARPDGSKVHPHGERYSECVPGLSWAKHLADNEIAKG